MWKKWTGGSQSWGVWPHNVGRWPTDPQKVRFQKQNIRQAPNIDQIIIGGIVTIIMRIISIIRILSIIPVISIFVSLVSLVIISIVSIISIIISIN